MPLLNRKRTILSKIEATYGTDPTPTGAANAILCKNLTVTPMEMSSVQRDVMLPYLGNLESLPGAVCGKLELEVEMAAGAGAVGTVPPVGQLLRACGMSETVSAGVSVAYAPISSAFESITNYFNLDGVLHKMIGSRGSVSLSMTTNGIPTFKFAFTGLYAAVTDAAAPTVVLTAWRAPLTVNNVNTTGLTLHGYAGLVMSDFSLDLANTVVFRSLVGGSEAVLITDRAPTGSITFEATAVATKDWFGIAKSGATGAFSVTHGTVAGNKVKIDAPKVQLTKPTYTDKDGVAMIQTSLSLVPNTGNDELVLTFL